MKRLLATTAIATMAFSGAASAQSLLQRVLASVDSANPQTNVVTGIFANTADNLFNAGVVPNVVNAGGTSTTTDRTVSEGDILVVGVTVTTTAEPPVTTTTNTTVRVAANGDLIPVTGTTTDPVGKVALGATLLTNNSGALTVAASSLSGTGVGAPTDLGTLTVATVTTTSDGDFFSTSGINASVTNILRGLDRDSATTGLAAATSAVTANVGNIATTALGAVNTGDITLIGANTVFNEDVDTAVAGTSRAVKERVSNTVTQLGTDVRSTQLALNSALNETNINASVTNITSGVNANLGMSGMQANFDSAALTALFTSAGQSGATGTVFAAADVADIVSAISGGISTTALGAVNTGSITSGADNQVRGVISSIVGNAATNVN